MTFSRLSSALPLFIVSAVVIASGFLPASADLLRSALFVFSLVFAAGILGPELAPRLPRILRGVVGGFSLLAAQSILQTGWYYLGGTLGPLSDGIGLGISILITTLIVRLSARPHQTDSEADASPPITIAQAGWTSFAVLAFTAASLFIIVSAIQAATTRSINSPWPLFPAGLFIAFSTLFASAFLVAIKGRRFVTTSLVALTLCTVAALTSLVYPLGYGFDGFLHRASEEVILTTGTLTPAPPSYIGQYTLVTWFARVLHIPPGLGDVWLVALVTLLLPIATWHLAQKKRAAYAIVSLLLALPLAIISATTPQNVAYLLGLFALLWLVPQKEEADEEAKCANAIHWFVPWLCLGWSLATHPLAGLPFALAGIGLTLNRLHRPLIRRIGKTITLIGSALVVPLAFSVRAWAQSGDWSWGWLKAIPSSLGWFMQRLVEPATHLALWPDWANWQSYLATFLLMGAALFAAIKERERRSVWTLLIGFSLGAVLSSWLLQISGDFSFLISYERQDYASRLLIVAQLCLVPAAIVGLGLWFEVAERAHPRMRAASLLFGIAWFSANVYNALPRHDAAMIGHGWNVAESDLETVRFIDKQADGKTYTVLANQTVSAAAISSFGFKRYVGDVFYYPIPTGGPLYEQFLQMMNRPAKDIAQEAGELGQSDLVYVVVNKYWWQAERIVERLKVLADRTWNVEQGSAYIFLFDLKASSSTSTTRSGA
ncbi:hypothetical protein KBD34_01565 [Patescibacteria group bacterium]|nr:hypothetical protein [Patescibacteria group bacterium]